MKLFHNLRVENLYIKKAMKLLSVLGLLLRHKETGNSKLMELLSPGMVGVLLPNIMAVI